MQIVTSDEQTKRHGSKNELLKERPPPPLPNGHKISSVSLMAKYMLPVKNIHTQANLCRPKYLRHQHHPIAISTPIVRWLLYIIWEGIFIPTSGTLYTCTSCQPLLWGKFVLYTFFSSNGSGLCNLYVDWHLGTFDTDSFTNLWESKHNFLIMKPIIWTHWLDATKFICQSSHAK